MQQEIKYYTPSCHSGAVEVIPGLLLSGKKDYYSMVDKQPPVDILVPLDSVGGDVWKYGWRGEIRYLPIDDFNVIPKDVAEKASRNLADEIRSGKRVGMFCIGGHGRTGYMASLVLGFLGVEDPVEFLRKNYCQKVVETEEQLAQIAEILGKPEIVKLHSPSKPITISSWKGGKYGYFDDYYDDYLGYGGYLSKKIETKVEENKAAIKNENFTCYCYDCTFLDLKVGNEASGRCLIKDKIVMSDNEACHNFVEYKI